MPKFVFFTDLDGTLLDLKDYSFEEAKPAVKRIKETQSALVFSTSKTKAETDEYEKKLGISEPVIVENGGAIYIPKGYFSHSIEEAVEENDWLVIKLGTEAKELEKIVDNLEKTFGVKPFHRTSVEELVEDTGLSKEQVIKAKQKQYIASFKRPEKEVSEELTQNVEEKGYTLSKGKRFWAVMKGNNKGKAVKILIRHFRKDFEEIFSVGLGDAPNDVEMLKACDRAFAMPNNRGKYFSTEFEKVLKPGPEGWNKTVLDILKEA